MTDMNKVNVEALENVAGGYETHTVHNDAVSYANCRKEPGLNSKSRRTAMYGTRSCWQALMTPAGSQAA